MTTSPRFRPSAPEGPRPVPWLGGLALALTLGALPALTLALVVAGLVRPAGPVPWLAWTAAWAESLGLIALAGTLAVPIGWGTALALEELPMPEWLRGGLVANLKALDAVPPVLYGLIGGAATFEGGRWLGALAIGLMVGPGTALTGQRALRAVPSGLREAALALGATRWRALTDHVWPAAGRGLWAGATRGLARGVGEGAPLLVLAGAWSGRLPFLEGPVPLAVFEEARRPEGTAIALVVGLLALLTLVVPLAVAAGALAREKEAKRT